jgi:hypothetical protein
MATWPAAPFPQTPERAGYSDSVVDNVLRSSMGYGPAKLRALTTATLDKVSAVFTTDDAGYVVMLQFYATNKAIAFDWDNTLGGGVQSYRFLAVPLYQEVTCDVWRVQVQLERLP